MLPEVQDTYNLNEIGIGAISTVQELVGGIVTLPGGFLVDRLRKHWGTVLAVAMGGFGFGWLTVGLAPVYPLLLFGMVLVGASSSMWHLPAQAALSNLYPGRRGTVLSFHGIGGNIGDVVAPPITGLLLLVLTWQNIISIYAIGPLLLTFAVIWAFRKIGQNTTESNPTEISPTSTFKTQLLNTKPLLKDPVIWGIAFVEGLRGMAFIPFVTFLPLYLDNDVQMSVLGRSLHMGLLIAVGVVAAPLAGYLSDRIGRKAVLVPGSIALCALGFLLLPYGTGVPLTIIIAAIGLFLYGDHPILTATALDRVDSSVVTTTLGLLSFTRFTMAAFSPLIAGALYKTINIEATFIYIASIYALAAITVIVLPLKCPSPSPLSE